MNHTHDLNAGLAVLSLRANTPEVLEKTTVFSAYLRGNPEAIWINLSLHFLLSFSGSRRQSAIKCHHLTSL